MFSLKPKEDEFFKLFVESSQLLRDGALTLKRVTEDPTQLSESMRQIYELEHQADEVNDAILDRLNQTFITPLDREDIYALANMLDSGVDFIHGIIERMTLYGVTTHKAGAEELGRLLAECTEEIASASALLGNIKKNQEKILSHVRMISVLESEGDRFYRQEVARLFECTSDPIEVIKWKDILEYLENTLDHCEDVADMIRGVVMKYA